MTVLAKILAVAVRQGCDSTRAVALVESHQGRHLVALRDSSPHAGVFYAVGAVLTAAQARSFAGIPRVGVDPSHPGTVAVLRGELRRGYKGWDSAPSSWAHWAAVRAAQKAAGATCVDR